MLATTVKVPDVPFAVIVGAVAVPFTPTAQAATMLPMVTVQPALVKVPDAPPLPAMIVKVTCPFATGSPAATGATVIARAVANALSRGVFCPLPVGAENVKPRDSNAPASQVPPVGCGRVMPRASVVRVCAMLLLSV